MNEAEKLQQHYEQVNKWCESRPTKPTFMVTMLYGSQNYGLATLESDVDTKTIVLPSMAGLISGEQISTELRMLDGSIDNCKDIRLMFDNYFKANINFLETLFTPHYLCAEKYLPEFTLLRSQRNLIANCQPHRVLMGALGMARQKFANFDHPYGGKMPLIEKYGYDPKQLHHLARLYYFIESYCDTMDFATALQWCWTNKGIYDEVMEIKVHPMPLEEAEKARTKYMQAITAICDKSYLPNYNGFNEAEDFLHYLKTIIITNHIRKEL